MTQTLKPEPERGQYQHALERARRLADRARQHDAAGAPLEAERCRRQSFALVQYVALTADDMPAPNAYTLDRLLSAHGAATA